MRSRFSGENGGLSQLHTALNGKTPAEKAGINLDLGGEEVGGIDKAEYESKEGG